MNFSLFRLWPALRAPLALMLMLMAGLGALGPRLARAQGAPDFGPVRPLTDVLENMEGAPWSAVQKQATQEATVTLGPKHRNIPDHLTFYAAFEGNFIPASDNTRLAIFSGDGCNVYIDGQLVWSRLNVGQHLPALTQSLYALDYEMVAGHSYDVRVEYSNTLFAGTTDADGATLFAYTWDENADRPYVEWRAGSPINCAGIRWPGTGATIAPGAEGRVSAFLATDFDQRDATIEGVMTTGLYSDPCSYLWTASGGTFKNGVNTGEAVVWIAPTTPGTYTIGLTVDDQNQANQPAYENGVRNDAARGYNDEPLTFSVQVTVQ